MKSWWRKLWLRLVYGPIEEPQKGAEDVFAERRVELGLPPGRPMKRLVGRKGVNS